MNISARENMSIYMYRKILTQSAVLSYLYFPIFISWIFSVSLSEVGKVIPIWVSELWLCWLTSLDGAHITAHPAIRLERCCYHFPTFVSWKFAFFFFKRLYFILNYMSLCGYGACEGKSLHGPEDSSKSLELELYGCEHPHMQAGSRTWVLRRSSRSC